MSSALLRNVADMTLDSKISAEKAFLKPNLASNIEVAVIDAAILLLDVNVEVTSDCSVIDVLSLTLAVRFELTSEVLFIWEAIFLERKILVSIFDVVATLACIGLTTLKDVTRFEFAVIIADITSSPITSSTAEREDSGCINPDILRLTLILSLVNELSALIVDEINLLRFTLSATIDEDCTIEAESGFTVDSFTSTFEEVLIPATTAKLVDRSPDIDEVISANEASFKEADNNTVIELCGSIVAAISVDLEITELKLLNSLISATTDR